MDGEMAGTVIAFMTLLENGSVSDLVNAKVKRVL